MSDFVKKASSKIEKLSDEQILRVIQSQQQELALTESILDSVQEGFLLLNKENKVLFHNSFFSQFMAVPNKKKNIGVENFFSDEELKKHIRETIESGLSESEYFFNATSSIYGEMEIRVTGLYMKGLDAYLFTFKDFTFFRKLYDEFRRSESLAAMTTMAAGVAHEIKNPLASISIYLQLLQKKLEKNGVLQKKDADKSFGIISEEIERLNKIAVDFLFAVKPLKVNPVIQSINVAASKAVELARGEASEKGINIETTFSGGLPSVRYDSALIEQCILNLLKNSIQAITRANSEGRISVSTYLDGNNVKLSVEDNGCGMSEEVMNKIFEPYYTTKASGTGLGLTNIFKIMKEHEGDISVTSTEGEGSVFTLTLPVPKSQRMRLQGGNDK